MKTCFLALQLGWLVTSISMAQTIVRESRSQSSLGTNLSNLSREKDAFYIEGVSKKPLTLKVKQDAVVYNNLAGERRLGVIPAGTTVSVVAISDRAIRVRGRAEHDNVSGWVGKGFLQDLDPKVMENITKMLERQKLVDELIRKKEIAIGMTISEVESVLGVPTKRSSRMDKSGTSEVYEYIAYRIVPQQVSQRDFRTGQMIYSWVNTKVETGRKSVVFENGIASSIEETENRGGRFGNVPMPIEIDLLAP